MTAVIYSAIYGGYDHPKLLPNGLDARAYLYTDRQDTADLAEMCGWVPVLRRHRIVTSARKGNQRHLAPMLAHKYWKTHPHRATEGLQADVALWVDGSMVITASDYGARCLAALGDRDIAFTLHPWRDCAIQEGRYSATLPRYADTRVAEQTEFYARFHPDRWGLVATGAIAYRLTEETQAFAHAWWEEQLNWSHQDQVSLPVLLRLTGEHEFGPMAGLSLRWNYGLPWEQWWSLHPHEGVQLTPS